MFGKYDKHPRRMRAVGRFTTLTWSVRLRLRLFFGGPGSGQLKHASVVCVPEKLLTRLRWFYMNRLTNGR